MTKRNGPPNREAIARLYRSDTTRSTNTNRVLSAAADAAFYRVRASAGGLSNAVRAICVCALPARRWPW